MNKAYLFEAHTIQPYILEGGKLAEMVGASEILEELVGKEGPLDSVLQEMGLKEQVDFVFSRRGGGAFYLLFKEAVNARQLMEVWSLIVSGFAPGLKYTHACYFEASTQREAIKKAKELLGQRRNWLMPELPEAGPWVRRSPRTGKPARAFSKVDKIWLDKAAEVKQKTRYAKGKKLSRKFLNDGLDKEYEFPRNMEHLEDKQEGAVFPFNSDNHNVGIIHADGNGLGQILIKLADKLEQSDEYANVFYELSKRIDKATQAAAGRALVSAKALERAVTQADKKVIPARPLILGGDDLTIIVRADLALEYARDFILFFEQETEKELAPLHRKYPDSIPKQMTACAGVAFLKSQQPFSFGYALAESLCREAKKRSKQNITDGMIPGSLAFHRVTSSFIDEYSEALKRELTSKYPKQEIQKTLGAYGAGLFADELPSFDVLEQIKNLFIEPDMARGPTRHFLTLVSIDSMEAADAWRRWRKNMGKNSILKDILKEYDGYAAQLGFAQDSPFVNDNVEPSRQKTFIGDLINWLAAAGEGEQ
ncbi:MAG: hypothetical protein WAW41_05525 [Methylobacter sp.]